MLGIKKDPESPDTGKGSHRLRRGILIAAGCLLGVALVLCGAGYGIFHHYYSILDTSDPSVPDEPSVSGPAGTPDGQDTPAPPSDVVDDDPGEDEPDPPDEDAPPPATDEEVDRIEDDLTQNMEQMESDSQLYSTDAFNILLIGVDSRKDSFSGRSDCMILFSINKTTKKITMTSFLRDIYVSIPGYVSNRLNAAHSFGGSKLLTETIKVNFGIQVDRCVTINFFLVMDAVDALGGVDLDLSAAEIRVMNGYIRSHNALLGQPAETDVMPEAGGTYHVDGNQALAYARVRYVGSDFARTGRQRTIVMKCLDKLKGKGLGDLNSLAEQFLPRVRTDLTEGDCASLLMMMLSISDYQFQSMAIPVDGTYQGTSIRGRSVLTIDFAANSEAWHKMVDGDQSE